VPTPLGPLPALSAADAERLAEARFGVVAATAHPLPGERDQNLRLDVDRRPAYVLKVSHAGESPEAVGAQVAAARRAVAAGLPCQQPVPALDGSDVIAHDGHLVRLVRWLPGVRLADVRHRTPDLLTDVGRVLGRLTTALAEFDHPGAHRSHHWDVAQAGPVLRERRSAVVNPARRALLDRALEAFEREVEPHLGSLRRAVVHGDANDHNVLVDPGDPAEPAGRYTRVGGLLDFGDLVHSVVVAEPAVAAAYGLLGSPDPLGVVATVVAGFHAECPLDAAELAVLWALVRVRLAVSVCHSAVQQAQRPDDPYLSVSEEPAWAALVAIEEVHPRLAHYALRVACGLPAHPDADRVLAHLQATTAVALLGAPWSALRTFPVDLSVGSPTFAAADLAAAPERFDRLVREAVDGDPDAVGLGGYGEARLCYTAPEFATAAGPGAERRTVHLGLDVWSRPGTPVHAPLAGRVLVACDNTAWLDYGPVVVLEHATDDGLAFFSLYGHLSRESLGRLAVGDEIPAGGLVGWVGTPADNGGWAPHVHVQLLLDLLDLDGDVPGVAAPSQRALWLGLSPDPALLVQPPPAALPAPLRPLAQTLAERRTRLGRNLSLSYAQPLRIVRGAGAWLYDDEGRAYLDSVNNVAHVGHCHPRVVAAGSRQMAVLATNTRYLHEAVLEYARRLTATLPDPLSVCYLVNSGSEANDLALRLVRTFTGARDMVCLEAGYHGHTQALIEVSPYKHAGPGGSGPPEWVRTAALPDPYRGPFRGYGRETARAYAADVRRCVDEIRAAGRPVAGMIAESMVGCGGQVVLPEGYLAEAADVVRAAGGLFIVDEVQVGFGRVGRAFWGFATQGVLPDVVTVGKPAGDGYPLAAVVTTQQVADAFANGMEYFNTFGGNPVAASVGLAVLDVLEEERLPERAEVVGRRIVDGAWQLARRHPIVGDVRGLGMYVGIELVLDRESRAPAGAHAAHVVDRMKALGVLVSTDGPAHNVLKIKPPLVWTADDADRLLDVLDRVLGEDALQL